MNILKDKFSIIFPIVLLFTGIILFCLKIGAYPFIDTEETMNAVIAKDMLNNSAWFDIKHPPLLFWLINASCLILGKISPFAVRLPVVLTAASGILILYFGLKQLLTKSSAFIISAVFMSCFGIILFSKTASNGILYAVLSSLVLMFGAKVLIKREKSVWAYLSAYFFTGINVSASGLYGFIPLAAVLAAHITAGQLKYIFKPKNLMPGICIFLLTAAPFYMYMYELHGAGYIKEFLSAYSVSGFENNEQIYSFLLLLIFCFFPWCLSFLFILFGRIKGFADKTIWYFNKNTRKKLKRSDRFISLNAGFFLIMLLFAAAFSAKEPYLLTGLLFPAACITGMFYYRFITKSQNQKIIYASSVILYSLLIICSLTLLILYNIQFEFLKGTGNILLPLAVLFFIISITGIFSIIVRGKVMPFALNIILMMFLSSAAPGIFNFISNITGENELLTFAESAANEDAPLAAYMKQKKYSLEYYYDKPVIYIQSGKAEDLKKFIKDNPDAYIAVSMKDMLSVEEADIEYTLLTSGKKYCLIKRKEVMEEPKPELVMPEEFIYTNNDEENKELEEQEL